MSTIPEPHAGPWYHYSPTKLPVGTRLTPGHDSPWGNDLYGDGTEHRRNYVWLSPTVTEAAGWAELAPRRGERGHLYRVEPSGDVLPWNGTGSDGWVADSAHITEELPYPWKEPRTAARSRLAMSEEQIRQLHRGVGLRKQDLPPELSQRIDTALEATPDPDLARHLLDYMNRNGEGMGGFWAHSKDGPWLAEGYSRRVHPSPWENNPADYSVVLSADWDGSGSIYDWDTDPDYRKLEPGTNVSVNRVRLTAPGRKGWIDLGGDPSPRTASWHTGMVPR